MGDLNIKYQKMDSTERIIQECVNKLRSEYIKAKRQIHHLKTDRKELGSSSMLNQSEIISQREDTKLAFDQ